MGADRIVGLGVPAHVPYVVAVVVLGCIVSKDSDAAGRISVGIPLVQRVARQSRHQVLKQQLREAKVEGRRGRKGSLHSSAKGPNLHYEASLAHMISKKPVETPPGAPIQAED